MMRVGVRVLACALLASGCAAAAPVFGGLSAGAGLYAIRQRAQLHERIVELERKIERLLRSGGERGADER